jgi:hypothetical protein
MEFIEKYPDKPWNWNSISYNPNITMDIIEKYPDKPWNWYHISNNEFKKDKIIARQIIQRWYRNLYKLNNNIILFIFNIDTLYKTKQASYVTTYLKYNIAKYL